MKTLFFSILIYLTFFSSTYATSFNSIIGIGYDDSFLDKRVTFNGNELKGLKNEQLELLKYEDLSLNGERKNNFAEYLKIPPSTVVSFFLWVENRHDSNVELFDIDLYLSRTNPISGDLTRIGAVGDWYNVTYEFQGNTYIRNSKVVKIVLNKTFDNQSTQFPDKIYEFVVTTPIKIEEISFKLRKVDSSYDVDFKIVIDNTSGLKLCNILLEQSDIEFCIEPYERKIVEWTEKSVSKSFERSITISDPNRHYLSTTSQMLDYLDFNPETNPGILNTSIGQFPIKGELIKNLTVELLPYKINSDVIKITIPKKQIDKEDKRDSVKTLVTKRPKFEFEKNSIIGSKIKPKNNEVLATKIIHSESKEPLKDNKNNKKYLITLIVVTGTISLIILIRLWYY